MESSPLNRTSSAPSMVAGRTDASDTSTTNTGTANLGLLTIETARALGHQYLEQGRGKSQSSQDVLTRVTPRTDLSCSPNCSPKPNAQTTWSKILGKAGCLSGDKAHKASGLDNSTLQAAANTANLLSCVIAIRFVAKGAVDAMRNGAVPKGLEVKGKSANFGPHNALIPRDPRLSKIWDQPDRVAQFRLKNESAIESGQVNSVPLQLNAAAIQTMATKGLITLSPYELQGKSSTIYLAAVDSLDHPINPDATFRLVRQAPGLDTFTVEYTCPCGEAWRPLEVLANPDLKPYTADFDLFTVMPATHSPLLKEDLDNFKNTTRELDEKFPESVSASVGASDNTTKKHTDQSPLKAPRVFNFENVEGLDSPSQPRRPSSKRTSIIRAPLPLTPIHLYTPKRQKEPKPTSRLALNMSKLQLAAQTVVSMLAHSERTTPQSEVGSEGYWESQVRIAFNTAHKSLTHIQVNPIKHGNEQNNPAPELVENITFIKPNGEVWFAETEPAAMAMIYLAREEGHLGYLNKGYFDEEHTSARYQSGVQLANSA